MGVAMNSGLAEQFTDFILSIENIDTLPLVDISNPDKATPLDEWLGIVVSLADGQHTIQQLIDYMAKQYHESPIKLEETLHSVIERLEEGKIIQLSTRIVSLPYYLSLPIEELDIEKAKKLIKEDDYKSSPRTLN